MPNCSPLNSKLVNRELLYIDKTSSRQVTITNTQTAIVGNPTCVKLSTAFEKTFIVNRTGNNIPLCDGQYYVDLEGNTKNYLPAFSATTISYSTEQYWQQVINDGGISQEIPNTSDDTPAISITLSGTLDRNIEATLNLSEDSGNSAEVRSDGLYVPTPPADVPNSNTDNNALSVNLSGTLNRDIEVVANISQNPDNQLSIEADGFYVPAPIIPAGALTGNL